MRKEHLKKLALLLSHLVPVDFLPVLAGHIAYAVAGSGADGGGVAWITSPDSFYFKVVPTTDPNITLGLAFAVLKISINRAQRNIDQKREST